MGQPDDVVKMAKPFLDIVAFSLIPLIIFQGYKQFADGKSETKVAMWANLLCNVVHFFLNVVLIYGFWFFPKLGMLGAAYGTVISRFIMLIYIHYSLTRKARFKTYFEGFSFKELQKDIVKKIVNLGLPSSMQMFFEVALFTGAIWLSGRLGTAAQAANQIALSLATFTFMFVSGLGVAAMVRVGNHKGSQDFKGLQTVARSLFLLAIIIQGIFAFIFVVLHPYLPELFNECRQSTYPSRYSRSDFHSRTFNHHRGHFSDFRRYTGCGFRRFTRITGCESAYVHYFCSLLDSRFPISIYLGLYTDLKAIGIWIGLLAGLSAAAIFLYLRFNHLTNKLIVENHS